ncbi:transmembrane protein 217-like [Ambystoma mexicanum]|uniref:transmembrane protein 217-like n=1 Tax=Ambystoma mexicanum TaxID=8296 RepID=UPI0037E7A9AA
MRNYFAAGCLGVTPRGGTIVAAVSMMLVSIMHMVFEGGHLKELVNRLNISVPESSHQILVNKMYYYCYITYGLLCLTIIICFVLLASAYLNIYKGVLVYISWMLFYELCRLIMLMLTYLDMHGVNQSLNEMQWVGIGLRLPIQVFFMVYVVTYLLELMESRGRPLLRRRRVVKKRRAKSRSAPPALKFVLKEDA